MALLATGPAIRGLPGVRLAPCRAAAAACAAAPLADGVLVTATLSLPQQHSSPGWTPVLATAASILRPALTQRVARRDLAPSSIVR